MNKKKQVVVLTGSGGRFGSFLVKKLLVVSEILPVFLTSEPEKLGFDSTLNHKVYKVNLSSAKSIKNVFCLIYDECGDIDVLINNAAVNTIPGFSDFINNSDDQRVYDTYKVNVAGALLCIKYTLNRGDQSGKKIINILTRRAFTGHQRHVEYYSSKAGLYNATKTLAADYPMHCFRNIMSGHIKPGRGGDPNSMWNYFIDFIYDPEPPHYLEIYYESRAKYYLYLLRCYYSHFKSCKRIDIKRENIIKNEFNEEVQRMS
jgi:NAD(P)-dependent dehydrogenase (short-subunit alcohol dehydrogenase family)|tara:strand:- start:1615 stop:2394 length:780 start_codon:yes stop_codon:yes gene_type:complete